MNSASRKIGGHVSAAGGIDKAVERAAAIGANCVQVFSGSPRVWQRPDLASINAEKIYAKQKELSISPIFTHAIYLVNLASDNPESVRKSTEALKFELSFDGHVSGAGVIVHVGSHQGRGWDAVREQVAKAVIEVLKDTPENSHFLIENAASKKKIGGDLADIRWLMDAVKSPRLQWCVDTCHAFAGGHKLSELPEEMEKLNLVQSLACIHANDSRDPFDSSRDRHANIGEGTIPRDEMHAFLTHPLINEVPIILEVPGTDDKGPDKENIDRVKALL